MIRCYFCGDTHGGACLGTTSDAPCAEFGSVLTYADARSIIDTIVSVELDDAVTGGPGATTRAIEECVQRRCPALDLYEIETDLVDAVRTAVAWVVERVQS